MTTVNKSNFPAYYVLIDGIKETHGTPVLIRRYEELVSKQRKAYADSYGNSCYTRVTRAEAYKLIGVPFTDTK